MAMLAAARAGTVQMAWRFAGPPRDSPVQLAFACCPALSSSGRREAGRHRDAGPDLFDAEQDPIGETHVLATFIEDAAVHEAPGRNG